LTARNAKKCSSTAGSTAISAGASTGNFLAFFASPQTFYYNATTTVSVYVAGLPSTTGVTITFSQAGVSSSSYTFSASSVNSGIVTFSVPAGSLGQGSYDVSILTDANTCPAVLRNGIRVAASLTIDIISVDPAFIWSGEEKPTSVTIATNGGMISTPDILLVPNSNNSAALVQLRAVVFNSPSSATALVPTGLAVGSYDLIILNPDGGLGVRKNGITIVDAEPPRIDSIAPVVYRLGSNTPMTLFGDFFHNATASMACDNAPMTELPVAIPGQSNTTIDMSFPDALLAANSFCIITVVNDNGAYTRFSGIGIAASSYNLATFRSPATGTPNLVTARRGTSTVVGRATKSSKFLYAIGGDAETSNDYVASTTTNMNTVESINVDIFGHLGGSWSVQRNLLPTSCSLGSSAAVGQYVYFSCGHEGTGASNKVYKANVLDPNIVPGVHTSVLTFNSSASTQSVFSQGLFYYRVSAVYASDDEINPGGETLPSELIAVKLPSVTKGAFTVKISWDSVNDAVGYRIYRTSYAGAPPENATLIHNITSSSSGPFTWTDDGSYDPNGSTTPFPPGSLGNWTLAPSLITGRAWAAMVASNDPSGAAPLDYTFMITGGIDSSGTAIPGYETMKLTINPSEGTTRENHTITEQWTSGSSALSTARYGLSAATALSNDAPGAVPQGSMFIYFGPGRTAVGTSPTGTFDGAWFYTNGSMNIIPVSTSGSTPTKCGYCLFTYTKDVGAMAAGGGSPTGSATSFSTGIVSANDIQPISNWNSDPARFTANRVVSCVKEGAWVYAAGGTTNSAITPDVLYGFI
jgi:hypothetical protein